MPYAGWGRPGRGVLIAAALSLLAPAGQDDAPIKGYGPWTFGMRHFEVRSFEAFGPYLPVESTGGLETRNGVFEGERTNVSFAFDDLGLTYVQIWAYEGTSFEEAADALHRVYAHMGQRFDDLMLGNEKLPKDLSLDELIERLPEEYRREVTPVSAEQIRRLGRQPRIAQLPMEPVWAGDGARVVSHFRRSDDVGAFWVMLFYARATDPERPEPPRRIETAPGEPSVVETTRYLQARMIGAGDYERRSGDSALLLANPDLRSNPDAYFLSLNLGPSRAVVAIVGNYESGFELRAMPPVVQEPVSLPFTADGDDHVLESSFLALQQGRDSIDAYPVRLRLVMDPEQERDRVFIYPVAMRRGVLEVDGRALDFGITGDFGVFNEWNDVLYFDLDDDGEFSRTRNSSERFIVSDGYLTVGNANWVFAVDRLGNTVSLEPLDDSYPPRAALDVGAVAPDFSFVDLNGIERKLSDYRGRVVLLDFWGVWCAPCHSEAPHLVAAYERFHEAGFEIIGIDIDDSEARQRAFMSEFGMSWPQARESKESRPIHDLYRNWTWPTHYLLDENGVIIEFNPRGEELIPRLEAHFGRSGRKP